MKLRTIVRVKNLIIDTKECKEKENVFLETK